MGPLLCVGIRNSPGHGRCRRLGGGLVSRIYAQSKASAQALSGASADSPAGHPAPGPTLRISLLWIANLSSFLADELSETPRETDGTLRDSCLNGLSEKSVEELPRSDNTATVRARG